jgi:hypothetical protein
MMSRNVAVLLPTERKHSKVTLLGSPLKTMILINKEGKEVRYDNVNGVFSSTKRSERNGFFGTYLTDGDAKPTTLRDKIDEKIKSLKLQLANLQTLRVEISRLAADEEAKKLQGTVNEMSPEEAQVLLNQLKQKLGL